MGQGTLVKEPKRFQVFSKVDLFCFFALEDFSFFVGGITICHCGSKDEHLHYFKQQGPFPRKLFKLEAARHVTKQQVLVEEVNSDRDEVNGYHSNESLEFKIDENNIDNPEFHVI